MSPLILFCFKFVLALEGFSEFHRNLRIGFSVLGNKAVGILIGIVINL